MRELKSDNGALQEDLDNSQIEFFGNGYLIKDSKREIHVLSDKLENNMEVLIAKESELLEVKDTSKCK